MDHISKPIDRLFAEEFFPAWLPPAGAPPQDRHQEVRQEVATLLRMPAVNMWAASTGAAAALLAQPLLAAASLRARTLMAAAEEAERRQHLWKAIIREGGRSVRESRARRAAFKEMALAAERERPAAVLMQEACRSRPSAIDYARVAGPAMDYEQVLRQSAWGHRSAERAARAVIRDINAVGSLQDG